MKTIGLFVHALISSLIFIIPSVAEENKNNCCEEDHIRLVQDIEKELMLDVPLFLTERDDLNNEIVELQVATTPSSKHNNPIPVKRIRIFDLSRHGNRVENGRLVLAATEMDADLLWRIGYDCKTQKIFHLYGFDDSTQGFNDLMESLDLVIGKSNHAFDVYYSFVKLLYREGFRQVIRNRSNLIQTALDGYSGRMDEKAFYSFLVKIPDKVRQRISNLSPTPFGKCFRIDFMASANGTLQAESILIDGRGKIKIVDSKAIYKWPTPK